MKLGQVIFTTAIAILIFVITLMTENSRFAFEDSIPNPFMDTESFAKKYENNKPTVKTIFTDNYEFLAIYPESTVDFSGQNREIISGNIFISAIFVPEQAYEKALSNFKNPFDHKTFSVAITQVKVGDLVVSFPNASIFIERNIDKKRLKIYAIDHNIELFFDNAKTPFVIPANMFVDISEDLLSEKTGKLYYTKLRKELRMQNFSLDLDPDSAKSKTDTEKQIASAILSKKKIEDQMKDYAQKTPKTWMWFDSQLVVGNVAHLLKSIQYNLAIGYPEQKKMNLRFTEVIPHFIKANVSVIDNEKELAVEELKAFSEVYKSDEWKKVMANSTINKKWNLLSIAQKSWLKTIYPRDPANAFKDFWTTKDTASSFADIDVKFSSIEFLIAQHFYSEALNQIIDIKPQAQALKVTEQDRLYITKLRRILAELLKNNRFFQQIDVFDLYGKLIRKEVKLYKAEEKDEIALESAQDIIFFLSKFPDKIGKSKVSSLLVQIFNTLDIEQISKNRQRTIFSEKEREMIKTISIIGSSGLTTDIIKNINDKKKYEEAVKAEENDRLKEELAIAESFTKKEFIDYLNKLKISTYELIVTKESGTYTFKNGIYLGLKVSGVFDIKTKRFTIMQVGSESSKGLSKTSAIRFLSFVEKNQKESSERIGGNTISNKKPSMKTQRAILARDLVRSYFEVKKIKIEMSNIIPLDFNYDKFEIKEAVFRNQLKVKFIYYKKADIVTDLKLFIGRNLLEVPNTSIKRTDLPREIETVLQNRLK